jgi:two-component system sensor histidine kinase KdpD
MTNRSVPIKEKLLACVSTSAFSGQLVSSVKRMAEDMNAKWYAVYVEEPNALHISEKERNRAIDHLRLAEQEGAETALLSGRNIAEELMKFANQHNVTKIIMGKPSRSFWKSIMRRSPLDQLVRISGSTDVYAITGTLEKQSSPAYAIRPDKAPLSDYAGGFLYLILANILCFLMYPAFHLSNIVMVYLLGVMLTAASCGRGPSLLVSCLSVLSFDFFFTQPRFSFTMEETQDIVTFIVMLLVALTISHLASRMRSQAQLAYLQEKQATAMHGLSHRLVSSRGIENILAVALQYISGIFDCRVLALLPDEKGKLHIISGDPAAVFEKDIMKKMEIAKSAFDAGRTVSQEAESDSLSEILYLPMQTAEKTLGILVLRPGEPGRFKLKDQLQLLESLSKQIALSLEVERLSGGAG